MKQINQKWCDTRPVECTCKNGVCVNKQSRVKSVEDVIRQKNEKNG